MPDSSPVTLPPDEAEASSVVYHQRQEAHLRIAPIPSPEEFAKYDKIAPGFADRVMQLSEKEQLARHENTDLFLRTIRLGTWFSFILPTVGLVAAVILALNDVPVWPVIIPVSASIIPSILSFWRRRESQLPLEGGGDLESES